MLRRNLRDMGADRRRSDAFGRALWDHVRGKGSGYEVFERDDGYVDVFRGREVWLASYPDWPVRQRTALRYARGRVLDLGCGGGRHALHLQGKGLDVLGIDASPLAVKVCRLRGLRNARVMSVDRISRALGTFGTVLMLGSNFGLFANRDKAKRLLARLHTITDRDARIIAESREPYPTVNPLHRAYQRRNRRRGRMPGQIRFRVRYQTYATPWFDYLLVTRREMERILRGTGWTVKRFIPPHGISYVAIIVKPE